MSTPMHVVPFYTAARLPSRGVLYDGKIPEGEVQIRKMTVAEIAMIENGEGSMSERLSAIIGAVTKFPTQFDPRDLLLTDRFAILLALRRVTHGPHYDYTFQCQYCGKVSQRSCDLLEDFTEKVAPDDLREPIEVKAPESGVTFGMRFLRGRDEDRILARNNKAAMRSNGGTEDSTIAYRLALQIKTVNGAEPPPIHERELGVQRMTVGDMSYIMDFVDEREPGIDATVNPECKHCSAVNTLRLPLGANFFRPSVRSAR